MILMIVIILRIMVIIVIVNLVVIVIVIVIYIYIYIHIYIYNTAAGQKFGLLALERNGSIPCPLERIQFRVIFYSAHCQWGKIYSAKPGNRLHVGK